MMGKITDRPQVSPPKEKRDSVEVVIVPCTMAMVTLSVYQRTLFYTLLMCTFLSGIDQRWVSVVMMLG